MIDRAIEVLADLAGDPRVIVAEWLAPAGIVLLAPEDTVLPLLGALMAAVLLLQTASTSRRDVDEGGIEA